MERAAVPPGWPRDIPPPGAPDWERVAVAWLLDQCPPDYRAYDVLRKHPVVLARFAAGFVDGAAQAAARGLQTVRADLRGLVPPEAVDAALAAHERESARLARLRAQVELVESALQGKRWVPRL